MYCSDEMSNWSALLICVVILNGLFKLVIITIGTDIQINLFLNHLFVIIITRADIYKNVFIPFILNVK